MSKGPTNSTSKQKEMILKSNLRASQDDDGKDKYTEVDGNSAAKHSSELQDSGDENRLVNNV